MQLKHLKLAGFKSFVDPTVVPFPSQLVAVVGPNGCGKSNIIDAVRWVMGESSAKTLRGESMIDVIFNGSSNRKSVGQASVELIFDNSLGRLTGQYASYQEIAVKRVVTRDGDSSYYLNGSRCRRRDINDIFLGTGAGARGYSIIGQDMISRLIEARPDDLRAYLEEAAGVSKYKERRRETVLRISHTRENLERVADIREELDKQLSRLERQAKAAERYQLLRDDERCCKAEILALKWQALTAEHLAIRQELNQLSLQHEQHQAKISMLQKDEIMLQAQLQDAGDDVQDKQAQLYQLGTEIARLEESKQQQQREKLRLTADLQRVQSDCALAMNQIQQDSEALLLSEQSLQELQSQLLHLQADFTSQQQQLQVLQQQESSWNAQWQQVQSALNRAQSDVQLEQVKFQHLEERRQHALVRLEKIKDEHALIQVNELQEQLSSLEIEYQQVSRQLKNGEEHYQQVANQGSELRQQFQTLEKQVHQAHDQVQALAMEQGVLTAAQHAALKTLNDSGALPQWEHNARLMEVMTVADRWLRACELVLGDGVQAILLNSVEELLPALPSLQGNSAVFVTQSTKITSQKHPLLAEKIEGVIPCWHTALQQVFAAETLEEALAWFPSLQPHESIITPDGYWLAKGWIRIASFAKQDEQGLLFRQQALANVNESLALAQHNLHSLQAARDQLYALIVENTDKQDELKNTVSRDRDTVRLCESSQNNKRQFLDNALIRLEVLAEEQDDLGAQIETWAAEKLHAETAVQSATKASEQYEQQKQQLLAGKTHWETDLRSLQQQVDSSRTAIHQSELQADREMLKVQQLNQNIQREQLRVNTLQEREDVLANQHRTLEAPDTAEKLSLEQKMQQYQQLEETLIQCRHRSEDLQTRLQEVNSLTKQEEQQLKILQDKTQQQQMKEQAQVIYTQNMVESLAALDAEPALLIASIGRDVTLIQREQYVLEIEEKIKRLGAINLVAIEEYEIERQRKQHLDEQYQDLTEALTILDSAIAKMDKETQIRLQETFDQINTSFQALFPRLFGGGRAMLTLTCDNLLEAGILVMAQPPGKRNSSIHLLSGGEKAMTAVALIFAIFQLNPSPFCMLDEVDAPLDDANVRRFCDLVKEMSQFVQFLFITHNKVTMELADHLIGVTMREPGVSRIVAVDVEQALSIAE